MARTSLGQVAYILALVGGILLVIFGLLSLFQLDSEDHHSSIGVSTRLHIVES